MGVMKLDYESLRSQARRYNQESGEVESMIGRLDNLMSDLEAEWEGQASRAFAEQYADIRPSVVDLQNLLDKICTQLISVADTIEQNEQDIANQIRQ